MIWANAQLWVDYYKDVFCKQITTFLDAITNRILPTFEGIESEATAAAEREWERLCSLPWSGSPDDDGSYAAEQAQDVGISYYSALTAVHQSLINLTALAMHHMFEQQCKIFARKLLHILEKETMNLSFEEFLGYLKNEGIPRENFSTLQKIEELRLVANTIKHAEGSSAKRLREHRLDLFVHPTQRTKPLLDSENSIAQVDIPMSGEDIYLTIKNIKVYSSALESFWQELSTL